MVHWYTGRTPIHINKNFPVYHAALKLPLRAFGFPFRVTDRHWAVFLRVPSDVCLWKCILRPLQGCCRGAVACPASWAQAALFTLSQLCLFKPLLKSVFQKKSLGFSFQKSSMLKGHLPVFKDKRGLLWRQAQDNLHVGLFPPLLYSFEIQKNTIFHLFSGCQGMKCFDPQTNIRALLPGARYGKHIEFILPSCKHWTAFRKKCPKTDYTSSLWENRTALKSSK